MSIGFVIGNGPGRLNFDLRQLYGIGSTYGCNAIHRDFYCQNIVCVSRTHLNDAISWGVNHKGYLWTTQKLLNIYKDPSLELLPEPPFPESTKHDKLENWTTIAYAALLSAQRNDTIIMLGADFSGNSIYHETENYPPVFKNDFSPHIQQLLRIISYYNSKEFIFVNSNDNNCLSVFENKTNVTIDTYNNLQSLLLT